MAEISYPFNEDNANGGSQIVSQTQWQEMATKWGGDRVDYPLVNTSYTSSQLPFAPTISGRNITLTAGSAWVGGFYYKLTGTKTAPIEANATNQARKDLIVLRADIANSAVTLEVIKGTGATAPTEPPLTRQVGGVWEMALHTVDVPANNGSIVTVVRRAPHPLPAPVAYPWLASNGASMLPRGTITVDLDNNGGGVQQEAFNGRDGYVLTRDFGKSVTYTPNTLYVNGSVPSGNRKGRWRWIAPNTYWFSVTIVNDYEDQGLMVSGSNWRAGVSLPVNCNSKAIQTLHGYLSNPFNGGGLPNMIAVTATTHPGTNVLFLHYPNFNNVGEGLDGLRGFPPRSTFSISGVLEAGQFSE